MERMLLAGRHDFSRFALGADTEFKNVFAAVFEALAAGQCVHDFRGVEGQLLLTRRHPRIGSLECGLDHIQHANYVAKIAEQMGDNALRLGVLAPHTRREYIRNTSGNI